MNEPQHKDNKIDQYRRGFVGGSLAAVAGLAVVPGVILQSVQAKPDDQSVTSKNRWGLIIDTSKCADGCSDSCWSRTDHQAWPAPIAG